jgi:hypothetical protein
MTARLILLSMILAAVACATGAPPTDSGSALGPKILSANEASITLTNIFFSNDANNLRIADEHCQKFGKVAQFVSREKDRRRYNCVRP